VSGFVQSPTDSKRSKNALGFLAMRMLIEDDGTFEIVVIKIVRVQQGEKQNFEMDTVEGQNNIATKGVMDAVRSIAFLIFGVSQIASLLLGNGSHL
ncbi:MAG TPA: hypothetical protein PK823_18580, partial [Novosphingobium sp.]|nr:hypothetical protein [Novosphingobium sp.]